MSTISISQILLLIFWFVFTFLVFVLALIARFYESNSKQITYYRLYIIPVILTGAASVRYASINRWGEDWFGDLFTFISGIILSFLCVHLYRLMTSGRK